MKNSILEDFYNEVIKTKGMKDFNQLSEDDQKKLSRSIEFAGYQFKKSVDNFVIALEKEFKAVVDKLT